ncbi:hypothetical protein GCM10009784_29320 [Arthrobacter parietis]|uniref:Uncharacterized protein n=1 Tax=Arthrobacter parietis TaxID=271434 RepID=A0ABP5MV12_9MICC
MKVHRIIQDLLRDCRSTVPKYHSFDPIAIAVNVPNGLVYNDDAVSSTHEECFNRPQETLFVPFERRTLQIELVAIVQMGATQAPGCDIGSDESGQVRADDEVR